MIKELRYRFTGDGNSLGRTLDDLEDGAESAGRGLRDLADDAQVLDKRIADTQTRMRSLASDLARADRGSDAFKSLSRDMAAARRELSQMTGWRRLLTPAGEEGATGFFAGFSQKIGPLLMRAPVSVPLAAAMAAGAPFIAQTVAGAVTAGVALASVGAGLKIAFQDNEVKAAGAVLADEVSDIFKGAARPFVSETVTAIGKVRAEFRALRPEIEGLFASSSRFVQPLTDGAVAALRELAPDLRETVENAEPLVTVLGEHLPKAADTLGNSLTSLSTASGESAKTLDALLTTAEVSVGTLTLMTSTLAKIGPFVGGPATAIRDAIAGTGDAAAQAAPQVQGITGWLGQYTEVAGKSAFATMSLEDQIRQLADTASGAFNAETRLADAIADATSKIHRNKAGLDANSQAGRANRDALSKLASQTLATRDAVVAQTKSSVHGEQVMKRGYDAFMRAAVAMNVSKTEADKLARSLGLIPPAKNVAVSVNTSNAVAKVNVLKAKIAELRNRNVYITGTVRWISTGLKVPGGTILERASGGPVRAGQVYKVGERGTELFVPDRDGTILPADATRRVMSGGPVRGGDGAGWPAWMGTAAGFEDAMERAFIRAMHRAPTRGGRDPAQMADVYSRGG